MIESERRKQNNDFCNRESIESIVFSLKNFLLYFIDDNNRILMMELYRILRVIIKQQQQHKQENPETNQPFFLMKFIFFLTHS